MKTLIAVMLAASVLMPAVAFAGSSTDAALGLGAFAVFNQMLGGVGIFQRYQAPPPPPIVIAPPPPAPGRVPVLCAGSGLRLPGARLCRAGADVLCAPSGGDLPAEGASLASWS